MKKREEKEREHELAATTSGHRCTDCKTRAAQQQETTDASAAAGGFLVDPALPGTAQSSRPAGPAL
jgi:hypothetical protein